MAKRDMKRVMRMPDAQGPYVGPGVSAEAVDKVTAYKAGVASRRITAGLPKTDMPVAGGRAPRIPPLDGPVQEGLTMEQHALLADEQARPVHFPPPDEEGFVEGPAPVAQSAQPAQPFAHLDIRPGDVLPDQVRNDPAFQEGQGCMYAAAQPHLAAKYGVIRGKQVIPPQKLAGPTRQLRPESVRDLQELQRLQKLQSGGDLPNVGEAEKQVPDGARAAAQVGDLPGSKPLSEEEQKSIGDAIDNMDDFEFDTFRQAMMRDMLNNKEQKTIIEGRLQPMDIGDLITQGYVTQRVPVVPKKFEPEFITLDGETDLAIKRMIMEESKSIDIADRYYLDKYSIMTIAAGLYAINGRKYGDYRNQQGGFDEERFKKKLSIVLRYPMHMLASLGVQQFWFETRVRSLFAAEKLGNG